MRVVTKGMGWVLRAVDAWQPIVTVQGLLGLERLLGSPTACETCAENAKEPANCTFQC
ncbi:hypothetical protein EMIT047CA2_180033 [Pseudomonas soli]